MSPAAVANEAGEQFHIRIISPDRPARPTEATRSRCGSAAMSISVILPDDTEPQHQRQLPRDERCRPPACSANRALAEKARIVAAAWAPRWSSGARRGCIDDGTTSLSSTATAPEVTVARGGKCVVEPKVAHRPLRDRESYRVRADGRARAAAERAVRPTIGASPRRADPTCRAAQASARPGTGSGG